MEDIMETIKREVLNLERILIDLADKYDNPNRNDGFENKIFRNNLDRTIKEIKKFKKELKCK